MADTKTEPRMPLTRERVLEAGLRIADEEGLDALTMRRLGQELGVQAMSLYNHVANKEDLRHGIVEIVMHEIEVPSGPDWKAALRQSAISAHQAFVRHPWACSLHMATPCGTIGSPRASPPLRMCAASISSTCRRRQIAQRSS